MVEPKKDVKADEEEAKEVESKTAGKRAAAEGEESSDEPQKKAKLTLDATSDDEAKLRVKIEEKFMVKMPEDFYLFWQFCKEQNHEKPLEALLPTLNLRLVGPFDLLANHVDEDAAKEEDWLNHWRFYFDPPEFQTMLADEESTFHIGYFRDTPDEAPVLVASAEESHGARLSMLGDNLFGAVYNRIGQVLQVRLEPFTGLEMSSPPMRLID